jgi:hypothetical protein
MAALSFLLIWPFKNVTLQIMTVFAEELKYNPQKISGKSGRQEPDLHG